MPEFRMMSMKIMYGRLATYPTLRERLARVCGVVERGVRSAQKGCAPGAPGEFLGSFTRFSRGARCASGAPGEMPEVFEAFQREKGAAVCAPGNGKRKSEVEKVVSCQCGKGCAC